MKLRQVLRPRGVQVAALGQIVFRRFDLFGMRGKLLSHGLFPFLSRSKVDSFHRR
jgi:hypothetical protein